MSPQVVPRSTLPRSHAARWALVAVLGLLLAVLLPARQAHACSCVPASAADKLEGAAAAFVGTLRDVEEPTPGPDGAVDLSPTPFRFEVKTVVAGELPEQVEVISSLSEASCGLGVEVGETAGVILHREDGAWTSGLCSTAEPAELIAAGDPRPPIHTPTATASPTGATAPAEPGPSRWPLIALGLAILGAVGVGAWWLRQRVGRAG